MQTITIEILNPKVMSILSDFAELNLIRSQHSTSIPFDKIETHWASEYTLAKDWLNPKENEAWKDL